MSEFKSSEVKNPLVGILQRPRPEAPASGSNNGTPRVHRKAPPPEELVAPLSYPNVHFIPGNPDVPVRRHHLNNESSSPDPNMSLELLSNSRNLLAKAPALTRALTQGKSTRPVNIVAPNTITPHQHGSDAHPIPHHLHESIGNESPSLARRITTSSTNNSKADLKLALQKHQKTMSKLDTAKGKGDMGSAPQSPRTTGGDLLRALQQGRRLENPLATNSVTALPNIAKKDESAHSSVASLLSIQSPKLSPIASRKAQGTSSKHASPAVSRRGSQTAPLSRRGSQNPRSRRSSQNHSPLMSNEPSMADIPAAVVKKLTKEQEEEQTLLNSLQPMDLEEPSSKHSIKYVWRRAIRQVIRSFKFAYSVNAVAVLSPTSTRKALHLNPGATSHDLQEFEETRLMVITSLLQTPPKSRSNDTINQIEKILSTYVSFARYSVLLRKGMAKAGLYLRVGAYSEIVKQGHSEVYQYLVLSGRCEQEEIITDGNTAFSKKSEIGPGGIVGECSLNRSDLKIQRNITVRTKSEVHLMFLSRETIVWLAEMEATKQYDDRLEFLAGVYALEGVAGKHKMMESIIRSSLLLRYESGATIVAPKDRDYIYFLLSGTCKLSRNVPFVCKAQESGHRHSAYDPGVTVLHPTETMECKRLVIGNIQPGYSFPRAIMTRSETYSFYSQQAPVAKFTTLLRALISRGSPAILGMQSPEILDPFGQFDSTKIKIPREAEDYMAGLDMEVISGDRVDCLRISRNVLFWILDTEALQACTHVQNEGLGGTPLSQIQEHILKKAAWAGFKKETIQQVGRD